MVSGGSEEVGHGLMQWTSNKTWLFLPKGVKMSFHCQNLPNTNLTRRMEPLHKKQTEKLSMRDRATLSHAIYVKIIRQDTSILQSILEKPVIELSQFILTIH